MTAPPPAPPPAGFPAPAGVPAPARPRRTWIVVLVSVLVAILLVAGAGTALFVANTLPPYSAARDFIGDLVDGKVSSASGRLCRGAADRSDDAITSVLRNFGGGKTVSVNPFTVDRADATATVEYVIRPRGGGDDRVYVLPLRKEGDDWKPCPGTDR